MSIIDVIKYEGDNSTFIWKHPCEDFNTTTQLIVHESQEAIFFVNGQIVDIFSAGRHTLETQNIPLLRKIINIPTGGESAFHCEVYFINKTVQMALKWGTDSKVRFLDSNLGIPLEIGACGEMNLSVIDSRKLLLKLVGTMHGIAWGENGVGFTKSIQNAFRPLISTAVKSHLSTAIKANNINILEIDENLEMLSKTMLGRIIGGFEEYGLTIPQFYITNIALPENDPNFKRMKELYTVSFQTRMIQADALVKTAKADAEAEVAAAYRKVEMERQTTETEIAKSEAERDLMVNMKNGPICTNVSQKKPLRKVSMILPASLHASLKLKSTMKNVTTNWLKTLKRVKSGFASEKTVGNAAIADTFTLAKLLPNSAPSASTPKLISKSKP